uniref:Uncharacterized protein n=1 Tax=Tanacetum cinerariifolium TaxID=118510 RepID=A0A6L2LZS8_TANCI|nr:hypothetical protein [Tanacetum cinerariifolium]
MAGSVERGGPEGTDDREETPPTLTKEQIEGHVSALKSLIKSHNQRNKGDPIRLDFESEDTEVRDMDIALGKEVMGEDLGNPFKEARSTPLTRRIKEFAGPEYKTPANIELYNGTTDPEDHLSRFANVANSGEWPMPVWYSVKRACFKEPHKITKIVKKANDSLTAFKERWTMETGIMGVPEVMKISSFIDSVKSFELAKRFSNKVPTTVNEMMERLDDFVRSEEAYARTGLPKGEVRETHRKTSHPFNRRDNRSSQNTHRENHEGMSIEAITEVEETRTLRTEQEMTGPQTALREESITTGEAPQQAKVINVISVHSVKEKKRKGREITKPLMNIPISFLAISSEDVFEEPLIVEAGVEGYLVRRVYVDEGSSVEVMFEYCFENLDPRIRAKLKEIKTDLVGRHGLKTPRAIPSTVHSMMKFPTPKGVATLVTRTIIIAKCRRLEKKQMIEESSEEEREVAAMEEVLVNPSFPDQRVTIGGGLSEACRDQLKYLLEDNMRFFAWQPSDMTGVPRQIIEHTLNVNPSMDPVCQKRRTFSMEKKSGVITNEVAEWVKAGIVRPVKYPTLVDSTFQYQIGRNLEAYVDDMVIKSKDEKMLLADIEKTFDNLKRINMKLNPKKFSFGVEEGKFLGYMVTSEGIRANPKKTKALVDLQSPKPYMHSLQNSAVLLTDRRGRQCPMQYVSRKLNEVERNYVPIEKLALSLIHTTRRLRRYFEAHPVKVITDQLIENILNNTETSEKLAKYAVELRSYNIMFIPCDAVKVQVLADFLSDALEGENEELYFRMPEVPLEKDDIESWTLFIDGASSPKGLGAGLVLIGPSGIEYTYVLRLTFPSTNPTRLSRRVKQARISGVQSLNKGSIDRGSQRTIYEKSRGVHCSGGRRGQLDDPHYKVFGRGDMAEGQKRSTMSTSQDWSIRNGIQSTFQERLFGTNVKVRGPTTAKNSHDVHYGLVDVLSVRHRHPRTTATGEGRRQVCNCGSDYPGSSSLTMEHSCEAVIPAEIGIPTYQTLTIREGYNEEEMRLNLDILQEMREMAAVREAGYKTKMEQYYNKKVHPPGFRLREIVFRRNEASRVEDQGKLGPKWERPYMVVEAYEIGSYKLHTLEEKEVPRTWHAINLHKCYM